MQWFFRLFFRGELAAVRQRAEQASEELARESVRLADRLAPERVHLRRMGVDTRPVRTAAADLEEAIKELTTTFDIPLEEALLPHPDIAVGPEP